MVDRTVFSSPKDLLPFAKLAAHTDSVDFVKLCEAKQRIVSAGHDGTIRIWDLNSLSNLNTIQAHSEGVFCCDISPNSNLIASCSPDGTVGIWDSSSGTSISKGTGHNYKVYFVLFLDDTTLYSCGRDKMLLQWDLRNMQHYVKNLSSKKYLDNNGTYRSLTISGDKSYLLATLAESKVELHSLPQSNLLYCTDIPCDLNVFDRRRELIVPPRIVFSGKFLHGSNGLITAHQDCMIRRWQVTSSELTLNTEIKEHLDYVRHIEISEDDSLFVSTCQDGGARIWETATNRQLYALAGQSQIVVSCI